MSLKNNDGLEKEEKSHMHSDKAFSQVIDQSREIAVHTEYNSYWAYWYGIGRWWRHIEVNVDRWPSPLVDWQRKDTVFSSKTRSTIKQTNPQCEVGALSTRNPIIRMLQVQTHRFQTLNFYITRTGQPGQETSTSRAPQRYFFRESEISITKRL